MRPAVLAAMLWFEPRLAWTRAPVAGIARRAARVVMHLLDQRRQRLDH